MYRKQKPQDIMNDIVSSIFCSSNPKYRNMLSCYIIEKLPEEKREILRQLKSDDLQNPMRIDYKDGSYYAL